MAMPQLRRLRRGYPVGLCHRASRRGSDMGMDHRHAAAACFFRFLENNLLPFRKNRHSCEKIFIFCENFVCICEKMGYNKVE
jgi:hypothetical protein